jgi:hypothetical protein
MSFRRQEETIEDKIKKHQGLSGNEIVQTIAFQMVNYKNQLDELSSEKKALGNSAYKIENELFRPFRKSLRDLLSLTEADIKDEALVKDIYKYLNQPYGNYPTQTLTALAQKLYVQLRKMKIIWISLEHEEETTASKLNKW